MKLIAHVQLEIDDRGVVTMKSLGYTLAGREPGPVTTQEITKLVEGFTGAFQAAAQPPQQLTLEAPPLLRHAPAHANGTTAAKDLRSSPQWREAASSLTRLGFTAGDAEQLVAEHGPPRCLAVGEWVAHKSALGGVGSPRALVEACLRRKTSL